MLYHIYINRNMIFDIEIGVEQDYKNRSWYSSASRNYESRKIEQDNKNRSWYWLETFYARNIEQDSKVAHDSASLVGIQPWRDTNILAYIDIMGSDN